MCRLNLVNLFHTKFNGSHFSCSGAVTSGYIGTDILIRASGHSCKFFLWSLQTNSYHGMGFISLYCSCVGMYLTSCTLALYLSEWKTEFLICQYVFRRSLLTARLSHCILIQHFYDVLRFQVVGMQLSKENTYTESHFRIHCTVQELWIFCVLRINYLTYNRWH